MKIITSQKMYREWVPGGVGLYHQPAWMDVFSEDWSAMGAIDSDGQPIWMWPFLRTTRYGIYKYGRIPFCAGNSPVILNATDSGFLHLSPRWMAMHAVDDRDSIFDKEQMSRVGWKIDSRYFQFFTLVDYPLDFRALSRSKQKRMRKDRHLELVRLDSVDQATEIILPFLISQGWKRMTADTLRIWWETLSKGFDHYLFGVQDREGHLLAVQWMVGYRNTLYGWLALRHPQHRSQSAREWLMWNIIQWARDRYEIYDLGGSSMPGVRKFNLEMGADERHFYRYVRYRPAALALVRRLI